MAPLPIIPSPSSSRFPFQPGLRENLNYQEESLLVTVNQLLGRDWSLGARYLYTQAVLNDNFPDVPSRYPFGNPLLIPIIQPKSADRGGFATGEFVGHLQSSLRFLCPRGGAWDGQSNSGYTPGEPGADFWQFNAFAGYRFLQRRAEVTLGLLNITDQNYNLNPLNLYNELPRSRTLALSLRLNF